MGWKLYIKGKKKKPLSLQIKETKADIETMIPAAGAASEIDSYPVTTPDYYKRLNIFCVCTSGKGFVNVTEQRFSIRVLVI